MERIRRLVSLLGMPQHRFASIHVVGTNGKSSVAEMTGALLRAHGKAVGVYLSPHTERWSERVRIGGAEIAPGEFARSVYAGLNPRSRKTEQASLKRVVCREVKSLARSSAEAK
jgi:dihydrofolate synthase/folylpolyglutamate synthase